MKKILLFLTIFLALFMGCQEENNPIVTPLSQIEISASKTTVSLNELITLQLSTEDNRELNSITWQVSDSHILTITEEINTELTLLAIHPGTTTVTATEAITEQSVSLEITVLKPESPSVYSEIQINTYHPILLPQTETNLTVSTEDNRELHPISWAQSEPQVIEFVSNTSSSLKIKGLKIGSSIITATEEKTGKTAFLQIEVKEAFLKISDANSWAEVDNLIQLTQDANINLKYDLYIQGQDSQMSQPINQLNIEGNFQTYLTIDNLSDASQLKLTALQPTPASPSNAVYFQLSTTLDSHTVVYSKKIYLSVLPKPAETNNHFTLLEKDTTTTLYNVNSPSTFEVKVQKQDENTYYEFDFKSISQKTGLDYETGTLQYSGSKMVSGQEVLGKPIYDHNGTDWIQYQAGPTPDTSNPLLDIWTFTVQPNLTARNRKAALVFRPYKGASSRNSQQLWIAQIPNYSPERKEKIMWIDGVTPPDPEDWREFNEPTLQGSAIVPNYYIDENGKNHGWYHVNKAYDYSAAPDSAMCWAMSAANQMHWWIDRQKPGVIEKLIEIRDYANPTSKYKDEFKRGDLKFNYTPVPRPSEPGIKAPPETIYNKSDIGKTVRRVFVNRGGNPRDVFRYYFESQKRTFIENIYKNPHDYGLGLLNDIPLSVGYISDQTFASDRDWVNQSFNNVLLNGQSVSISQFTPNDLGPDAAHAITVWGIIYDFFGDVVGLYVADNNVAAFLSKIDLAYVSGDRQAHYANPYYRPTSDDLASPEAYSEALKKYIRATYIDYLYTLHACADDIAAWVEANYFFNTSAGTTPKN